MKHHPHAAARLAQRVSTANIAFDPLHIRQHVRDPLPAAGQPVVQHPHRITTMDQSAHQMRANESTTTCDYLHDWSLSEEIAVCTRACASPHRPTPPLPGG